MTWPTEKISRSLDLIAAELARATKPIVCSSFGKDSLVLLDLVCTIRRVPVLFFVQYPKQFPEKYRFAWEFIKATGLQVWTLPPRAITHIHDGNYFDLYTQYGGTTTGPLLMSMGCRPWVGTDTNFVCAVDALMQPLSEAVAYPWDCTFIGHKQADPMPLAKPVEYLSTTINSGSTRLCLPLADWTDEDVWTYIKTRDIPYDTARYDEGREDVNPDRYPVCFACLDTRRRGEQVFCPVLESMIDNRAQADEWHARQKLLLLQSVPYASFRLGEQPSREEEQQFLAHEEQWPLWTMKKVIDQDRVYLRIDNLRELDGTYHTLKFFLEESVRLVQCAHEAGIAGLLIWVSKSNFRMQAVCSLFWDRYAEDDTRYWYRYVVEETPKPMPTLKEFVQHIRAVERTLHALTPCL